MTLSIIPTLMAINPFVKPVLSSREPDRQAEMPKGAKEEPRKIEKNTLDLSTD
jgi:hypothetical protein